MNHAPNKENIDKTVHRESEMPKLFHVLAPLMLLSSVSVRASLEVVDDPTYGIGSVTLDTDTGLQWLDLSLTVGLSADDVIAGSGGFIDDFDIATVAQVETLFTNAGWNGVDQGGSNGTPANLAAASLLLDTLGVTLGGFDPAGQGAASFGGGYLIPFYQVQLSALGRIGCLSGFSDPGCNWAGSSSSPFAGVYLVRDAPAEPDTDGDGVVDTQDNCTLVSNANQRDSNGDGFGNLCDADLNGDCIVNTVDLGQFKAVFFSGDPDADLDGDGVVNSTDLGIFRSLFFVPPGPSGVPNDCDAG